jgi:hypothetical protein
LAGAQDERRLSVRQNRVVLTPVAGAKSAVANSDPTGVGQPQNPPTTVTRRIRRRGEHGISRKAITQGMPDASAEPVCSCAHPSSPLRTRPRVRRAPGIPCALSFRGRTLSRLGRIAPREGEVMSFMKHNAFMKIRSGGRPMRSRIPPLTHCVILRCPRSCAGLEGWPRVRVSCHPSRLASLAPQDDAVSQCGGRWYEIVCPGHLWPVLGLAVSVPPPINVAVLPKSWHGAIQLIVRPETSLLRAGDRRLPSHLEHGIAMATSKERADA